MNAPYNTPFVGAKLVPKRAVLTELSVRAAEGPRTGTTTLWDGSLKHFGLRISQGGTKSFIVLLGSGRRQVIGRFPAISLTQARSKAKLIFAERTLGRHAPSSVTWNTSTEQYLAFVDRKNKPRTANEYRRILKRYFPFGDTKLADITRADIARKLDKLADTPSQQAHALVAAKIFFNWALKRGYVDHNPCTSSVRAKSQSRTRVLTDQELLLIWRACDRDALGEGQAGTLEKQVALPAHFAKIVQLLILTGQRRGEIAALRAEYFSHNQQTLCLPATLTKNKREHQFPVGPLALSVLANLPSTTRSDLLFPARGTKQSSRPFNGWSKSKKLLDQLSGVTDWTLHDLRRTFATTLAQLGVAPHVIERLLNHITGEISGVSAVYNRATYLAEMRTAIDAYESHLFKVLKLA